MDGCSQGSVDERDARLSELLDRVERGETVTISRNGQPVAWLVAATRTKNQEKARSALEEFLRLRDELWQDCENPPTLEELMALRHEGHKY